MKRHNVVKHFISFLTENDMAIFSGSELCKEAYAYDRPGNFYLEDTFGLAVSFALGVALCSDKKVFVFVGEGDLLRDLSSAAQASASSCKNLILVVLDNGVYQGVSNQPNIFDRLVSKRGLFYDMGFLVQDYTKHFRDSKFKQLKNIINRLKGPVVVLIELSAGINKKIESLFVDKIEAGSNLTEFLTRAPKDDRIDNKKPLNLDQGGGIN